MQKAEQTGGEAAQLGLGSDLERDNPEAPEPADASGSKQQRENLEPDDAQDDTD